MAEYCLEVLRSGIDLSPSELYNMTLPELSAYVEGYRKRIRMQEIFFGNLTAAVYNAVPKKKKKFLMWSDIYKQKEGKKQMTPAEIKDKLVMMFGGNPDGQ
jgi:hypothetical protein